MVIVKCIVTEVVIVKCIVTEVVIVKCIESVPPNSAARRQHSYSSLKVV